MNSALLFLLTRSFLNGWLVRLRRLREPKYLIALALGMVWFLATFGVLFFGPRSSRSMSIDPATISLNLAVGVSFLLLAIGWLKAENRGGLSLNDTEATWLFSSPLSRNALFSHHAIKPQSLIITPCLMAGLVLTRWISVPFWIGFCGVWLLWNFILLHNFAVAMIFQKLESKPSATLFLKIIAIGLIVSMAGLMGQALHEQNAEGSPFLGTPFWSCPSAIRVETILQPAQFILAPIFSQDAGSFLKAAAPLIGIMAFFWWWIIASNVPWEDITFDQAKRREERMAAIRRGEGWRSKPKTRLAAAEIATLQPTGSPTAAFIWIWGIKTGGRKAIVKRLLTLIFVLSVLVVTLMQLDPTLFMQKHVDIVTAVALGYIGLLIPVLLAMPTKVTQQLRADLEHLDILLTMPTTPRQMLGGMLFGPLVSIIVYCFFLLSAIALIFLLRPSYPLVCTPLVVLASWLGSCLVVSALVPTLCFAHGLLAILFPAWQPKMGRAGIDNMGVGLIATIMIFAMMFATVGIAGGICAIGYFLLKNALNLPMGILLGSIVSTIVIAVEGWIAFLWMCRAFKRYDASEKTTGMRKKR